MATQPAQSLPSFAQAFSSPSLSRISSSSNALPPIQRRPSPYDPVRPPSANGSSSPPVESRTNNKKRFHAEVSSSQENDEGSDSNGRRSPRLVRIKEEPSYEASPSSQLKTLPNVSDTRSSGAPPPSDTRPLPSKRRRVTISGIAGPINTDVRINPSDNVNKSLSPVVMGFTIKRDDPVALEQVRSMLTVKQRQKELIEQRRGSTASIVSTGAPPAVNVVNPPPSSSEDRPVPPKPTAPVRTLARSPNLSAHMVDRRRSITVISSGPPPNQGAPSQSQVAPSSDPHFPSPSPVIVTSQPPPPPPPPAPSVSHTFVHTSSAPAPTHALPAAPISFAHRRAGRKLGGAKSKPADIVISPRDPQSQPVIQSAPLPRDQSAQGRFPSMMLPRLPQLTGSTPQRPTVGRVVPPTPTRLNMSRSGQAAGHIAQPSLGGGVGGRSPPSASIPIATTLLPPTPSTLHRPGYAGEKSAFLAPFETFYDALADSKQLKTWLGEQLQKAQNLTASLQYQQEQLDDMVSAAVEGKVSTMREEIYGLNRRVEELEHTLRIAKGANPNYSPGSYAVKGKGTLNGGSYMPVAPESYTFPPIEPIAKRTELVRKPSSPVPPDRDSQSDGHSFSGSLAASPVPFDISKRVSVSAMRLDPRSPAAVNAEASSSGRKQPSGPSSHSQSRELQTPAFPALPAPPTPYSSRGGWSPPSGSKAVTSSQSLTRRISSQRVSADVGGDGRSEGSASTSRRESVVVRPASPSRCRARSPMDEDG